MVGTTNAGGGTGAGIEHVTYEEWQAMTPEQQNSGEYIVDDYPETVTVGELAEEVDVINNNLSANGTQFVFDQKDGKYGYNTDPNRGADTFVPFKKELDYVGSQVTSNGGGCSLNCTLKAELIVIAGGCGSVVGDTPYKCQISITGTYKTLVPQVTRTGSVSQVSGGATTLMVIKKEKNDIITIRNSVQIWGQTATLVVFGFN